MVKFGQIWKWSYSKHVYQIPYAVCETAWEPSESPYGPDLDRVNYGPRNNSGEVDQLTFWQPKICAVETKNSADFLFTGNSTQIIIFRLKKPHKGLNRIPTVKLKISEKAFLKSESRISVTFKL